MPNINQIRESNFLKRSDVGTGVLVTIKDVAQYNIAKEGAPEELKWCIEFNEFQKPMVLNSTNAQLCAQALGSEETEDWKGSQIVLFDDPSVSYAGKLVGGIRVRASRKPQPNKAPVKPVAPPSVAPVRSQQPRAVEEQSSEPDDPSVPF